MNISLPDDSFREAFKPLHIPSSYLPDDTKENKVIYALAQLGEGTAAAVTDKLLELEPAYLNDQTMLTAGEVLESYFRKGLVKGSKKNGEMTYNLSKITHANDGEVDPDLLAPGLD